MGDLYWRRNKNCQEYECIQVNCFKEVLIVDIKMCCCSHDKICVVHMIFVFKQKMHHVQECSNAKYHAELSQVSGDMG